MINWNTDEKALQENFPKAYKLWRVVQLINYGLEGEKLNMKFIRMHWDSIKDRLESNRRKTLEWFIWKTPFLSQ